MTRDMRDSVRRVLSSWLLRLAIITAFVLVLRQMQGPSPWLWPALALYAAVSLLTSIMLERSRRRQADRKAPPPKDTE